MDKAWKWIKESIHPPLLPPPPPRLPFHPPPFSAPFNAKAEYHAQQHEEWVAHFKALLAQSRHVDGPTDGDGPTEGDGHLPTT